MVMIKKTFVLYYVAGLFLPLFFPTLNAQAQTIWPTKPVRLIVPIAAGGVTDMIVRNAATEISIRLGQPVVIDNRPGANGMIGAEACARATADGYTLCVVNTGITSINPLVYENHPFDPARALTPIVNLYYLTGAVAVPNSLPAGTVAELRALATNKPKTINFGTIGTGSYPEIFLTWLNREWKTQMPGIPYKGGGPVAIAMLSGEVQVSAAALGNFLGQIQGGQLRALAVSSNKRYRTLPQVATYNEAGIGDFRGHLWWGLVGPDGIPNAIIARLNTEFNRLFAEPRFIEFLENQAAEPATGTVEAFRAYLKADRDWTATVVKPAKISAR